MSGGGGFDPGKDLANLDKDLSLSQNAPLIAAATAMYFTGGAAATGAFDAGIGLDAMAGGAGMAIPVETAIPTMVEGVSAAAPVAEAAAPAAAASAVPVATEVAGAGAGAGVGVDAIGSGIDAPYVGQQATMPPNMAASAAPDESGVAGLWNSAKALAAEYPKTAIALGLGAAALMADRNKYGTPTQAPYDGPLNQLKYDPNRYRPLEVKPPTPYTPVYKDYRNMAGGGLSNIHLPRELGGNSMSAEGEQALLRMFGVSSGAPAQYATPPLNYDPARYDPEVGTKMVARPGMASGGIADLGGYSDGGRMLKGPGDGMSDSIPATIAGKQPARLANDEFVVPADVVSHLGNGSSDAGAKQLYKMMDKVRAARTGRQAQAKQINPNKYMPA